MKQVVLLAFREYLRTPEAMFWTYGFPLVLALALGLAFSGGDHAPAHVAVVVGASDDGDPSLLTAFEVHAQNRVVWTHETAEAARRDLLLGKVDLIVTGTVAAPQLVLDPGRTNSQLARLQTESVLRAARGEIDTVTPTIEPVDEPGDRYIDFLIPGLIALNLLGDGIYGIGYNVAMMRVRNLLRRLWVTPIGKGEFLFSFLAGRLMLAMPPPVVIVFFGSWAFGVPVRGSWFALAGLILIGAFTFTGIGLLIASRARTIEQVSGLMNVVMMPMWLLGGAFFSSERFPALMQPVVQAMPMTHLCDALRGVMLGTLGAGAIAMHAGVLLAFGVAGFWVALRLFRWT